MVVGVVPSLDPCRIRQARYWNCPPHPLIALNWMFTPHLGAADLYLPTNRLGTGLSVHPAQSLLLRLFNSMSPEAYLLSSDHLGTR